MELKLVKTPRGEYNLWQRRYWEHVIRDQIDLHKPIDYIHFNPVKHGLVNQVKDWPYSSFHQFVSAGFLDKNWGMNLEENIDQQYGDRIPDSATLHPGY